MKSIGLFFTIFIISLMALRAQEDWGLKYDPLGFQESCVDFNQRINTVPKEVYLHVSLSDQGRVNLITNDTEAIKNYFLDENDGFTADIVSREKFTCPFDSTVLYQRINGELIKPLYRDELSEGWEALPDGYNFFKDIGSVPEKYRGRDFELNKTFIINQYVCASIFSKKVDTFNWQLLDMGLYLDDQITYKKEIEGNTFDGYELQTKKWVFVVPFEQGKSNYSAQDIKPIYDSLSSSDYYIERIKLKAYSSIEGSRAFNEKLAKQRSNSIVTALQSYQNETIKTEIISAENWVDFLKDIQKTPYKNWAQLSKKTIRNEVNSGKAKALESMLGKHRKAVVEIKMARRDFYKNKNGDELVKIFNEKLAADDIETASDVESSIFDKIKEGVLSPNALQELRIPYQEKYVALANKRTAFRYFEDENNLLIALNELEQIEKLKPQDIKVKYNRTALLFEVWKFEIPEYPVDQEEMKKRVRDLFNMGLDKKLVARMKVNYHILNSWNKLKTKDYAAKDKSVNYLVNTYESFNLSDEDILSLSQFISYFSNYAQAEQILASRVYDVSTDEDLIFNYLGMTLDKWQLTRTDAYRTVMLNAIDRNKTRFCDVFKSNLRGGHSFQLLKDPYLTKTWCEVCSDSGGTLTLN